MFLVDNVNLRLRRRRTYWALRYALQWVRFTLASRRFILARGFEESTTGLSIFQALVRESVSPILLAGGLALLMNAVLDVRWPFTIGKLTLDKSAYDVLLGSVAGVTGVFLALYFAAVSTVAGAIYNRVPSEIRELLVREKVGGFYVSLLGFITVFSLLLLGFRGLGFPPSSWGMIFTLLLMAPGVFSFAKLGQRAFNFFDPTALADVLFRDLRTAATLASRRGYRWQDVSFQEHYRKQADRATRTLETLVGLAEQEEVLRGHPLVSLALKLTWYVKSYLEVKSQIPTDSRWFGQVPKYPEWYLADSTALDLATATMTGLTPKMVPDDNWLEDRLLDQVDRVLETGLRAPDRYTALNILENYSELVTRLGEEWVVSYARARAEALLGSIYHSLNGATAKETPDDTFRASLASIERVAMLPISASLGLFKSVDAFDPTVMQRKIEANDWGNPGAIYALGMPTPIREQLEYVGRRLPFEVVSDGRKISPDWYVVQLLYMRIASVLRDNLNALVQWTSSLYPTSVVKLRTEGFIAHAATMCTRGLEACAKLERHFARYQVVAEALDRAHVLPDFPKTDWFFRGWIHRIDETESKLHKELSLLILLLADLKLTPDFPDFIGEAVHRIGEACFRSLQENRPGQFKALFPPYFVGIFGVVERIRQKTPEYGIELLVPFLVEPLMDLVALSGYAYAWAQFHQNRMLWHSCIEVWDFYLHQPAARSKLESLAAGIGYRRSLFGLTPRDILRTRWVQILNGAIRSLPRVVDSGPGELGLSTRPEHPSRLIQVIGRHELGSLYDGIDVFVAIYLSHHPLADGIDFGRNGLGESLERPRRRGDVDDD